MDILPWVYMLTNIFTVIAVDRFMRVFFEEKRTPAWVYYLSCLAYPALVGTAYLLIEVPLLTLFCNVLVLSVITLNYAASWKRRVSAVVFVYLFMFIADISVTLMAGRIGIVATETFEYSGTLFAYVAIPLIIYLEAVLAQNFINVRKNKPVPLQYWLASVLIPLISIYVALMIVATTNINRLSVILAITGIFLCNILIFYLYDSLARAYSGQLETALLTKEREYYYNQCGLMQDSMEYIQSFKHDITNHLLAASEYIKHGQSEQAAEYLGKLIGNVGKDKTYSDTGNIAFDSIINYAFKDAEEKGMAVTCTITVPKELGVDAVDVVTILGNLLDNAVSAAANVMDGSINLRVNYGKGRLSIIIENTYAGKIIYQDGKIVSAKRDVGDGHGYGLKNVQQAVEKYDGDMDISHTDTLFSVNVLLFIT